MPSPLTKMTDCDAREFIDFVNKSVTPFHAVQVVSEMLTAAGFVHVSESTLWPALKPNGRYFITRNSTSIVAFALGGKYKASNGIKIVGAHTDSPNLSLKPRTLSNNGNYRRVGVQCYGGGLWHTWFDRDLTVAGRVIVGTEKLESKLIHVQKPLMRIPTLAIHLTNAAERDAFSPNKESHLIPVIATELADRINECPTTEESSAKQHHCIPLMNVVAAAANCKPEDIVDFDLSIVDTQPAAIGGVYDEFIFAPRIDNLLSCFCSIKALMSCATLANDSMGRVVCLFDHEEIGSESSQGAGGTLVPDLIEHLCNGETLRSTLVANSFLLSVDGAHACHPNYTEKHEAKHRPNLHEGPVRKYNANARYATNGYTAAVIKKIAERVSIPVQEFVVKNDSPCGSTIGPLLSALSGIKTVDIGNAMLSMHSVREMCGTQDVHYLTELIRSYFDNYEAVSAI